MPTLREYIASGGQKPGDIQRLNAAHLRHSADGADKAARALRTAQGSYVEAARLLDISPRQFHYLMRLRGDEIKAKAFGDPLTE